MDVTDLFRFLLEGNDSNLGGILGGIDIEVERVDILLAILMGLDLEW